MNNYPTIFVHGFIGWGDEDGMVQKLGIDYFGLKHGLQDYLKSEGFEVYTPAVGPFNSLWDRCCELYARLYGGRVDYGKVHSEKYGHERYGRTYPGILKDWGTPGNHEKINLVGHSFGGPTVRLFDWLMYNGSEEERAGTPAGELSGLFEGGHGNMIHTVTTLSGVNNGTTYNAMNGIWPNRMMAFTVMSAIRMLGATKVADIYDFHMDQWGVMSDPAKVKFHRLKVLTPSVLKKIAHFSMQEFDSSAFELGPYVMQKINAKIHAHEGTYYFARRACRSHKTLLGFHMPNKNMTWFCYSAGLATGHFMSPKLRRHGIDRTWFATDGWVNTIGTSAPLSEEATEWTPDMKATVTPGHWYNMPIEDKDHVSWNGLEEDRATLFAYYKDMLTWFGELE